MALDIRIAQFFKLTAARNRDGTPGQTHYYQNYFANEIKPMAANHIALHHSRRKAQQQP